VNGARIVEALAILITLTFGALMVYYAIGFWLVVWGTL
jgi:hypothetical protein